MKHNFSQNCAIEWIGIRNPANRGMQDVEKAELLCAHGIVGDKAGLKPGGKRQISIIQHEHFAVIASFLNKKTISPSLLKRNIVISGLNLSILKGFELKIGNVVLLITGSCAPCKKMEEELGFGGYNAMRNHGGMTASVESGGIIRVGDSVEVLAPEHKQAVLI